MRSRRRQKKRRWRRRQKQMRRQQMRRQRRKSPPGRFDKATGVHEEFVGADVWSACETGAGTIGVKWTSRDQRDVVYPAFTGRP